MGLRFEVGMKRGATDGLDGQYLEHRVDSVNCWLLIENHQAAWKLSLEIRVHPQETIRDCGKVLLGGWIESVDGLIAADL